MVDPGARMEGEVSGPNVWLELNRKADAKVQGFISRNKVGHWLNRLLLIL